MRPLDEVKKIISEHKTELMRTYKICEIGIFGSYVRGEQKKKSDIDILAGFCEEISLLDLVGAENFLSDLLRIKVDLVPKEDIRPELRDRILSEVVYI